MATGLLFPSREGLAQSSPTASRPMASPASATAAPVRRSKARAKQTAPVAEVQQAPTPPQTLEQQPPTPPQVSYQNGQLTIDSQNATLSQVLHSVQSQTGASLDMPPGAGSERVVAKLGPGNPKDVLSALLNGSKFNYVILGEPNSSAVQKVILMAASAAPAGGTSTQPAPQVNYQPQPMQPQAVEAPEDPDDQQVEPEPENQPVPGQPGMPGAEGLVPDGSNPGMNQAMPGGRTPEQMLQELQRMQQQQQQYQQQLNPANQQLLQQQQQPQATPFPSQPAPIQPQ